MWGKELRGMALRTGLSLFCALALLFTAVPQVWADSASSAGVEVEASFDQDSYSVGDSATITVTVTNTNDYDVTDLTVTYDIPDNMEVADGSSAEQTYETLAAGESTSFTVSTSVTSDGTDSADADDADDSDSDDSANSSNSGFPVVPIVIAVVVVVVIVVLVVVFASKKKGGKGPKAPTAALALLLAAAMAVGVLVNAQEVVEALTDAGYVDYWDYNRATCHDPSIVKDTDGRYYIFGSHLSWAYTDDLCQWHSFTNNISTDYNTLFADAFAWSAIGDNTYSTSGNMWAPDLVYNETMGKWCMYMSINGSSWNSSIVLLTADSLDGDWTVEGTVIYSGMSSSAYSHDISLTDYTQVTGDTELADRYIGTATKYVDDGEASDWNSSYGAHAIDPCVFYDEDGNLWMSYGSWSGGIYMIELDEETGLRDYDVTYETETDVSDAYMGIKIAGGYSSSGEASYIINTNGYYYLFISYGGLTATGGYQIRVYRSENPDGPYVDENGNSANFTAYTNSVSAYYGVKLFGSYDMTGIGTVQVAQGHNSAYVDDDGKIYLVYHTRFASSDGTNETHSVRVHQMFVNEDGWLVAAPYEYAGETISEDGYDTDEVVGTYEFILHEPTAYYTVAGTTQSGIIGSEETTTASVDVTASASVGSGTSVVSVKVSFEHEGSALVTLNEDGTVTGDVSGTWEFSDGANVIMELDGVTYKGVFLEQEDETQNNTVRMTFTVLGDNVTAWGVSVNGTDYAE